MGLGSVRNSLSWRLFLLLFATIISAFGAYAWINIRSTSRQWQRAALDGAYRFSDLIQHATHYGMLLNRKEDVHQIIRTIAESPEVERVRIYDKHGTVIFAAREEEIGTRVDLQAEACVTCHRAESVPLQFVPEGSRVRIFSRANGERVLGLINPIENAPECSNAACHAHPAEQSILGVLDVTMSMAATDERLAVLTRQALVAALLVAGMAGLLSAAFIYRLVRRPVRHLIAGARRVASGDLDTELATADRSEMGHLAMAFNLMTRDLREARRQLTNWSEELELRLQEKTVELSRTQQQIAHMDKMASLGKLAATVAHELNNPLAGILNYAALTERSLGDLTMTEAEAEELRRYLSLIQKEARRSGNIVKNLLTFARPSGAEFALHALNPILERATMLVAHHLEMAQIGLELELLDGDDRLVCDADQLQQAIVALLVNAVEAMADGGTLRLAAVSVDKEIVLSVGDTGVGIPEDALPHIFEPFFSSKNNADGAGLGLSVVYGIVQRHGGAIAVESTPGEGTVFRITLPRHPPPAETEERRAPDAMGPGTADRLTP